MNQAVTNLFPQGLFITLEGGEAVGKSTLAKSLAEFYKAQGYDVLHVSEPGSTPFGQDIRPVFFQHHETLTPEAEVGLLLCCKSELLNKRIFPHLARGGVVICDRFTDTLFAYQGWGKGYNRTMIIQMLKAFDLDYMPDFTLFLDLDPKIAMARLAARKIEGGESNSLDEAALDFHSRVREGFKDGLDSRIVRESWQTIDASQSIEHVKAEAVTYIREAMNARLDPMRPERLAA